MNSNIFKSLLITFVYALSYGVLHGNFLNNYFLTWESKLCRVFCKFRREKNIYTY